MRSRLLVFGRLPRPGHCKTRLAAGVGDVAAAAFYKATLLRTVSEVAACAATSVPPLSSSTVLYFSAAGDRDELAALLEEHGVDACPLALQLQSSIDLGARLQAALAAELCGADCAVVVGSDVPGLTAAAVRAAVAALGGSADLVVGPALDGGFYLLGLKAAPPGLFAGVRWSTANTLGDVLRNAATLQLRVAPLSTCPGLRDVDTASDLVAYVSETPEGADSLRSLAVATLACATADDHPARAL